VGRFQEARNNYEAALAIRHDIGDRPGEADTVGNLGAVYWRWGDYTQARDLFQRAAELHCEVGDRAALGRSLSNLGASPLPKNSAIAMARPPASQTSATSTASPDDILHLLGEDPVIRAVRRRVRVARPVVQVRSRNGNAAGWVISAVACGSGRTRE
jgi:tetratricopeptide (TPR) repeat protein